MKQEETCRTCLKPNETFSNIFDNTQNNKVISELIMECIPITIEKNDKFPSNICHICLEKLDYVYNFRKMAIESHKTLLRSYKNSEKSDKIEKKVDDKDSRSPFIKEESNEDINVIRDESDELAPNISTEVKAEVPEKSVLNTDDNCQFDDLKDNINDVNNENSTLDNFSDVSKNSECSKYEPKRKRVLLKRKTKSGKVYGYSKQQLQVLDNPDCKRIIESGMTRKEKSRETVYCQECKKSYSFKYYVDLHVHSHIGNLPFKCDVCGYRAAKKYYLEKHARTHSQTKDFLCTECGKAFFSKHNLKTHTMRHSDERPFKCKLCGKAFKQLITLQSHEMGHIGVKEFVCEECGRAYKHKRDLINHKATHTNEKNFECTTCGKKFLLKKGLDAHTKKHLGLKPFSCNICGKRFTAKSTWRSHARIHTGEKPFACVVCGKKFRQRECISRHMRIHTGETPYSCTLCPEKFKYSQHMQSHMKKHEKNKIVQEKKGVKSEEEQDAVYV